MFQSHDANTDKNRNNIDNSAKDKKTVRPVAEIYLLDAVGIAAIDNENRSSAGKTRTGKLARQSESRSRLHPLKKKPKTISKTFNKLTYKGNSKRVNLINNRFFNIRGAVSRV